MPYDPNDTPLREEAVELLLETLPEASWKQLARLYKIRDLAARREAGQFELLEGIAAARGYKLTTADAVERAQLRLINDFQAGKLGPVSLEDPDTALINSPLFRGSVAEEA
jgi:hypothetical protein